MQFNSNKSTLAKLAGSRRVAVHDSAAPSRHGNPFATCWTRPGAIPYQFEPCESAPGLLAKLTARAWRGAIVGPHGSGKSTLLETLKPAISNAGLSVHSICLRDGQRRLSSELWSRSFTPQSILIIDGYEQLAWFERLKLDRMCRRNSTGLLVTAHAPTRIPTLIRLTPNERLVHLLVAILAARVSTPVTFFDVTASHACHGSNVRETLFDLYDKHEQRRREVRQHASTYS